ncbi:bifunctional proline dehydrogenase/L-glutamate gamma-semialdehyde dehydrogenase PutA [Novispirillum itersonii]|uniref:bifunctional proline dehydrogenase/L-glutamate gamma-semialdehyde dehydrogenase PutA n=1 Tax=Novispirillum itersonii TaxID=189 RepID=UPI0003796B39|nr:bifunctional proline dehydrogenase/L-glutamate gamma-semialdehyde dehydrogenase PutA [Novispirillum itersonii]
MSNDTPMLFTSADPAFPDWRDMLASGYRRDEDAVVSELIAEAALSDAVKARVTARARDLVALVRSNRSRKGGVDAFMNEYDLSTQEGLTLMCLAEALLRIPDGETADRLIRDKLTGTDWEKHLGNSRSIFVNASTIGLMLTGRILGPNDLPEDAPEGVVRRLVSRLGEPVIRQALKQAMKIMGRQFVLGRTIDEAMDRAAEQEKRGYRYSYDMLGEAARTDEDATKYYISYEKAIHAIGKASNGRGVLAGPGISVKLSALHPRYEFAKRAEILDVLAARTLELAKLARHYDIGFCIDAEEADRLELSLELIDKVYSDPSLGDWTGFGLAVQAYQKRTRQVIDTLAGMVRRVGRRMNVRLVKGAYWDAEVKRAQEAGMTDYPVYTRKVATDVSYLACARRLFNYGELFFPQFATHNAHTAACILELAEGRPFEFQRLHGMGEELHDEIVPANKLNVPCRIYAPVGGHAELLSYLVRRLLENGANTSFVNRLVDDRTPIDAIIADPVERLAALPQKRHPHIPLPLDLYGVGRRNSRGLDLTDSTVAQPLAVAMAASAAKVRQSGPIVGGELRVRTEQPVRNPADTRQVVGTVSEATADDIADALSRAVAAQPQWAARPASERAAVLRKAADLMEDRMVDLMTVCQTEAGKTLGDTVAEVREAVDFLRYYAGEAERVCGGAVEMPDAVGRPSRVVMQGRGVFLCISPWNFPLAIFAGQVAAALAAGNAVIAKPAEQTPLIAAEAVRILLDAGVPADALHLLPGRGETVGAALVNDPRIAGVAFTGSEQVAKIISRSLAARKAADAPLIAETGGMNAMIMDSSALPEQVIRDAVLSAFGSAGQRCSALRVLFVQEDVADHLIGMLKGAMERLRIDLPHLLTTDVGPVIDEEARSVLQAHADRMDREAKLIYRCDVAGACDHGTFFAPRAYEIPGLHVLKREVFGPVLHVVRYKTSALDAVIDAIRNTGYGLTMGIHTRIDSKARYIHSRSRVGNTYINRNMIGAVVGVQPFGGEGLSGTGPKAGGPNYLGRFTVPVAEPLLEDGLAAARRAIELDAGKLMNADLPAAVTAPASAGDVGAALARLRAEAADFDARDGGQRADLLLDLARTLNVDGPLLTAVLGRDSGRALSVAAGEVRAAHDQVVVLARQVRHELSAPLVLPGPTGERNELRHHGRGVALVLADASAALSQVLGHVAAALGAGNAVAVAADPALSGAVTAALSGLNGLVPVLTVPGARLADLLTAPGIETVAVSGAAALAEQAAAVLAARDGAIVHLVTDTVSPYLLSRFCAERTLTVDMTAAGGNASLMTLNEDAAAE